MALEFVEHKVRKGENLHKIAKKYGFDPKNWRKLYDHPKNAAFKKKRKDPNIILPNDVLFVPKFPKAALMATRKTLYEIHAKHVATLPAIAGTLAAMTAARKKADAAVKKKEISAKHVKDAQAALSVAKSTYKLHSSHASNCKAGAAGDPKFTQIVVCLREEEQHVQSARKKYNAEASVAMAKKSLKKDQEKATVAMAEFAKQSELTRIEMDKLYKAHARTQAAIQTAIKEVEAMIAEYP